MKPITPRERDLLEVIVLFREQTRGVSPTYEEAAETLGLASATPVRRMVDSLVSKGHLAQTAGMARSIVVLTRAEDWKVGRSPTPGKAPRKRARHLGDVFESLRTPPAS